MCQVFLVEDVKIYAQEIDVKKQTNQSEIKSVNYIIIINPFINVEGLLTVKKIN